MYVCIYVCVYLCMYVYYFMRYMANLEDETTQFVTKNIFHSNRGQKNSTVPNTFYYRDSTCFIEFVFISWI